MIRKISSTLAIVALASPALAAGPKMSNSGGIGAANSTLTPANSTGEMLGGSYGVNGATGGGAFGTAAATITPGWIETFLPGTYTNVERPQVFGVSNKGLNGGFFASRASDNPVGTQQNVIGDTDLVSCDGAGVAHVCWAGYDAAYVTSGAHYVIAFNREMSLINRDANSPVTDPFNFNPTKLTENLRLDCGDGTGSSFRCTNPLTILPNGAAYNSGILFAAGSINPVGGYSEAIGMPASYGLSWYTTPGGTPPWRLFSSSAYTALTNSFILGTNTADFYLDGGGTDALHIANTNISVLGLGVTSTAYPFSSDFFNPGDAFALAGNLSRTTDTATGTNKIRFDTFIDNIVSSNRTAGPAQASVALGLRSQKPDFLTSTSTQEVDGVYISTRTGLHGDTSSILGTAAGIQGGDNFINLLEGTAALYNTSGTPQKTIRFQAAAFDQADNASFGAHIYAQQGANSVGLLIDGASASDYWSTLIQGATNGAVMWSIDSTGTERLAGVSNAIGFVASNPGAVTRLGSPSVSSVPELQFLSSGLANGTSGHTYDSAISGQSGTGAEGSGTIVISASSLIMNSSVGVSCSAGTVNPLTMVVTNGIVTHC